ncbi:formylglycine-generating enzyme family protein [Schlesneria paludicola]|uniref:formylglycine-generating enzyme family protein n=1 Tax=Schlesneria paludicola TaxID=360056 RepID=UPI00029A1672|nr:formylglycine-generating enzyme family protein [Schlesneria paludicola]
MICDSLTGSRILAAIVMPLILCGSSTLADEAQKEELVRTFVEEFVSITPGKDTFPATFRMGDAAGDSNEQPVHTVTLTKEFGMARYEVPQNLYEAVMGSNPSRWKGPRNSVEMMTWDDANSFCQKVTLLARQQNLINDAEVIRLPTEAEWEYCCRAGTTTRYSFGEDAQKEDDAPPKASILNQFGWHTGNAAGNDPPVGALKPNPWGLYDMHGYLWEFTADAWAPTYEHSPNDGSPEPVVADTKAVVIRSGSWKDNYKKLTSASRQPVKRTAVDDAVGFRCVKAKRTD